MRFKSNVTLHEMFHRKNDSRVTCNNNAYVYPDSSRSKCDLNSISNQSKPSISTTMCSFCQHFLEHLWKLKSYVGIRFNIGSTFGMQRFEIRLKHSENGLS